MIRSNAPFSRWVMEGYSTDRIHGDRMMNESSRMKMTLADIAEVLSGTVIGDETVMIGDVRGIDEAGQGDITFITNPKYRNKLEITGASAVLVSPDVKASSKNLVIVSDPYRAFASLLGLFYPEEREPPGISDRAFIGEAVEIGADAVVYPGVYIGRGARIGRGVTLHPGVCIGNAVEIGDGSTLYPNVTVYRRCRIGSRVILHAGVVVGSDGFGFTDPGRENGKVPQTGIVQIDDDVEVGANTTIDRGTMGATWIKRGTKIDNLVQIAHNVVIGEYSIIVAQVGISGSTKMGNRVIVGGQAGIVGHVEIGDSVMIAARSGIHEDVSSGQIVSGAPHMPHQKWLRVQGCVAQLPDMRRKLKFLEEKIAALEKKGTS
jgi:UDP-3-O-[3-hydroxymyristoyl] glucosamine N-acyltransferase